MVGTGAAAEGAAASEAGAATWAGDASRLTVADASLQRPAGGGGGCCGGAEARGSTG